MSTDVYCTLTREPYTILKFEKLDDKEKARLKEHLPCKECQSAAHYRRRARNGRNACFYAAHLPVCSSISPKRDLDTVEEADVVHVQQLVARDDVFAIDFTLTPLGNNQSTTSSKIIEEESEANKDKEQRVRHTIGPPIERIASLKLGRLLNNLLYNKHFATSDSIKININDYIHRPSKLFVRFEHAQLDVNEAGNSRPHFYWGTLSRTSDNLSYLNTAGGQKIGINIGAFKTSLLAAFNISDCFDTYSKPCLIFGYYAQRKGKEFIDVNRPEHIFIKMKDSDS